MIERSTGIRQWAFRNRLLYWYRLDGEAHRFKGSDAWLANVYTQRAPHPPAEFTSRTPPPVRCWPTHGATIYTYYCGDDAQDQLGCDRLSHPGVLSCD